jgi:hypothetical protein
MSIDPYAPDPQVRRETDNDLSLAYASDCEKCYRAAGGKLSVRQFACPLCYDRRCPKAADHDAECTGDPEPPMLVGGLKSGTARTETETG